MQHSRADRQAYHFDLIRDCLEGEDAVKDGGQTHVPKPSGMTADDYNAYLQRGSFYGAPAATLQALTGLALRKDPVVKLPTRLEPMRQAATHENAPMSILIEDTVREVMSMGRFGLLLDFPATNTTATTVPHISIFEAESILEFETAYVGGKKVLTKVHLSSDEDDADYGEITYELALEDGVYTFRRFARDEHKDRVDIGEAITPTVGGKPLTAIPFVMVSHQGIRPSDVTPPFLALCKIAISHFRNSCDREHAIFLTASPTPWIAGSIPVNQKPQTIGSGMLWLLPEGAEVGMLEFQGAGVAAQKALMDEKQDVMASLGARMLSAGVNRNETTDTATQRTRSELSLLHGVVVSVEAALNRLLRIAAEWVGAPADEATVTMSRDFIEAQMDHNQLVAQLKAVNAGAMSMRTFYENMQKGEIARADRSYEEERDLIATEGGDISPTIPVFLQ